MTFYCFYIFCNRIPQNVVHAPPEKFLSESKVRTDCHPQPYRKTNKMDQLNVKEQQEFQQIVEQKQMKDFMRLYSNLVSRCFDDCVNDFTSANLTNKETSCIAKCSEKFLKHSERVGQRFQEQKYV